MITIPERVITFARNQCSAWAGIRTIAFLAGLPGTFLGGLPLGVPLSLGDRLARFPWQHVVQLCGIVWIWSKVFQVGEHGPGKKIEFYRYWHWVWGSFTALYVWKVVGGFFMIPSLENWYWAADIVLSNANAVAFLHVYLTMDMQSRLSNEAGEPPAFKQSRALALGIGVALSGFAFVWAFVIAGLEGRSDILQKIAIYAPMTFPAALFIGTAICLFGSRLGSKVLKLPRRILVMVILYGFSQLLLPVFVGAPGTTIIQFIVLAVYGYALAVKYLLWAAADECTPDRFELYERHMQRVVPERVGDALMVTSNAMTVSTDTNPDNSVRHESTEDQRMRDPPE